MAETDQDRRRAVLGSAQKSDLDGLKAWQRDYSSDFIFPPVASGSGSGTPSVLPVKSSSTQQSSHSRHGAKDQGEDLDVIELSSDEDEEDHPPRACDVQVLSNGGTAAGRSAMPPSRKQMQEFPAVTQEDPHKTQVGLDPWLRTSVGSVSAQNTRPQKLSNALAREEIGSKESRRPTGSDSGWRDLAASRPARPSSKPTADVCGKPPTSPIPDSTPLTTAPSSSPREAGLIPCWACQVCTLYVRCAPTFHPPGTKLLSFWGTWISGCVLIGSFIGRMNPSTLHAPHVPRLVGNPPGRGTLDERWMMGTSRLGLSGWAVGGDPPGW